MEISFYGMNCVRLSGRNIAILCDPAPKASGVAEVKATNDVTLLTLPREGTGGHGPAVLPAKAGMVIDGPGEYEVRGAMITGVQTRLHTDKPEDGQRATIYSIIQDSVHYAFLGNVTPDLTDEQVELLGQVDVLILPVGNHGLTIGPEAAVKIISQLEPKIVIPTHFDDGATIYEVPQVKVDDFLKEMGATPESQPKLRINPRELPVETQVVLLQRQGN